MADNDAAATRGVLSAQTARNAAFAVAGIAVVTAAAGFLIEDPRQRSVVVGAALLAAIVWVLLGVLLERTIAAAPPPRKGRPARPPIATWAYFVLVAFALAGAGAGLNLVGYQTSTMVGTAAQLATAAATGGLFLLAYLLISRWRRARRG